MKKHILAITALILLSGCVATDLKTQLSDIETTVAPYLESDEVNQCLLGFEDLYHHKNPIMASQQGLTEAQINYGLDQLLMTDDLELYMGMIESQCVKS
jgi:hypothetical protein